MEHGLKLLPSRKQKLREPQESAPQSRGPDSHCNAVPEETRKMSETTAHDAIAQALETLEEAKSEPTGEVLERLTAQIAPSSKNGTFPTAGHGQNGLTVKGSSRTPKPG